MCLLFADICKLNEFVELHDQTVQSVAKHCMNWKKLQKVVNMFAILMEKGVLFQITFALYIQPRKHAIVLALPWRKKEKGSRIAKSKRTTLLSPIGAGSCTYLLFFHLLGVHQKPQILTKKPVTPIAFFWLLVIYVCCVYVLGEIE